MKRTQIYLTNEQWRELTILSSEENVPISELIRRAIDRFYKHNGHDDFDQALDAVAGMWKDRTDIRTTDEYVRSLRKSFRSSHGIQLGDALIAASATETDASLITFNDRHYPMPEIKRHRLQRQ